MANFSVNQVIQFYPAVGGYNATVDETSAKGTIGKIQKVQDFLGDQVVFYFKGADTVLKSDYIPIKNISSARAIKASDMAIAMKKVEVTLDSSVNGGAPVSGQDYVLGINFKGFFSPGDGAQYYKDAAVHATANMTASDFYNAMVDALNAAFAREDGATKTSNPYLSFSIKAKGGSGADKDDAVALVIEEKPQQWILGTMKARRVAFDVFCSTIYTGGDDLTWGTATEVAGTTKVGNGQKMADLEWFAAGERGDQYRLMCWPKNINTEYLIGSAGASAEYNVLEIHYAFTDTGVNSYRTEKDITIAFPMGESGEEYDAINDFIGAFNTAAGTSIEELSDE